MYRIETENGSVGDIQWWSWGETNQTTSGANSARIVDCVNACAGLDDPAKELASLREALAAAEAECAAARTALSPPPLQMAGPTDSIVPQPSPARRWADLRQAANANDATRARLGMGRIGEAVL
jgi:hypothetical protein